MDADDERALKILDEFARAPRETGPLTLSQEYLDHIARVEALAENQSGADKAGFIGPFRVPGACTPKPFSNVKLVDEFATLGFLRPCRCLTGRRRCHRQ